MSYEFRITVSDEYLVALGRATYNFAYLEKIAIDLIYKINPETVIPEKATARDIFKLLQKNIDECTNNPENVDLITFCTSLNKCIDERNKLLHASPYSSETGNQQIRYKGIEWTIDEVYRFAQYSESIAIMGSKLYYKSEWDALKKV